LKSGSVLIDPWSLLKESIALIQEINHIGILA